MPTEQTPIYAGHARFTVYGPGVIRLEYRKRQLFPQTPSVLVGSTLPPPVEAEVERQDMTITIATETLLLTYRDDGLPFSANNLTIEHPCSDGSATWRPGDADEPLVEMVRSTDVNPLAEHMDRQEHPGLLDRKGRRLIDDNAQVYRTPDDNWVTVDPPDVRGQDWWFFGYGLDYPRALHDFVSIFGRIPLVPRWVFGYWYSRWFEYSQQDIIDIAKRFREAGLPMDVMVVDTEWREHPWYGYNWHAERFPEPEQMFKELHDMGLVVPLNDHPGYGRSIDNSLPSSDTLVPELQYLLNEPQEHGEWACDWSSHSVTKIWKEIVLGKEFKKGMDFWWADGWAEDPFNRVKGQLWVNRHYYEATEQHTGKRGLVLSRWGGWGSHRYPVQFSGDTRSNWETLRWQIGFTADAGDTGACYWSHDIGGFHDRTIADDLYIRWVQFGAFSPVFRTHSAFGTREPFDYSETAQQVFRQVVRQRYAMTPYFYQLAREAHDSGMPICRPMYLHYPQLRIAYNHRRQFLLGRDVLVVPADMPGEVVKRTFWMPEGTWVRPETGETFTGASERHIEIPLTQIPLFFRMGSIIPHQEPGEYTRQHPLDPLYLDIYVDYNHDAELDFYEDDGETRAYEQGAFTRTRITAARGEEAITVQIGAPRGSFDGQLPARTWVVNCWLGPYDTVYGVKVNGIETDDWKITRSYTAGVCEGQAPFVAVRVHTRREPLTVEMLV